MEFSSKASIALALLLPFSTALAQTAPREEPPKWSLSLGVDPGALNFDGPAGTEARMVANLTRIWQAPGSRFSRHVSLMVGTDAPQHMSVDQPPYCAGCSSRFGRSYGGLTAGGSVDLFRLSRFTPYLQGGAGIYYDNSTSKLINPAASTLVLHSSEFSFGLNGGLGIKARFGSHEFFVEQLLHTFQVNPIGRGVHPLNFGIRF